MDSFNPMIAVLDNKLQLSKEAIKLLDASSGDRIAINYYTLDPENTFPVIGKSEVFTDRSDGNRLTKSNTVSFRGAQKEILLSYGKFFNLEPFKNYFKMVKVEEESENDPLQEEEQDLSNIKIEDNFSI